MADSAPGEIWDAFVTAMLAAGPVRERRSRFGGKPSVWTERREIAHLEAPGVVDLRITRLGWSRAKAEFGGDPGVRRDPARRDWIELRLDSAADVARLAPLLAVAVAANA